MDRLKKLGASLLPAISVLPPASFMLGIGQWLISLQSNNIIGNLLIVVGNFILSNISIIFALSVSIGLSKRNDVSIPISTTLSFLMITKLLNETFLSEIGISNYSERLSSFEKLNNQFIGIIIGIIVAYLFNHFSETKLPKYLTFFEGPRLIPILTIFITIFLGMFLFFVWPYTFSALVSFGKLISGLGSLGAGLFGFFNRILIPTGLHNALNSVFWFDIAGINDIANFWSSTGEKGIVGMYQAGFFPITMFGLPGAALAIFKTSPFKNEKTKSLLIANAFTAFLMGVSEPIELLFMFSSPILFLLHAGLTGLSLFVCALFKWTAGFGFSSGAVDYLLSLKIPIANQPYMLLVVGLVFFMLYYITFTLCIKKFRLSVLSEEKI